MEKLVIPPKLWKRIEAFLTAGTTGQIVLNVHCGVVTKVSLNEEIRQESDGKK